jgi:hypothetical protein
MSRMIRSRRAGASRDLPLYGRMLGLRHLAPSGFLCFVFLEGAVALGLLLALAELISWWGVIVLPVTVAVMVKLNDVVAGALSRSEAAPRPVGSGTVTPPPPTLRPAVIPRVSPAEDASLSGASTVDLRDAASRTVALPTITRAAVARPAAARAEVNVAGMRSSGMRADTVPEIDAAALNGPPASRQWADELDMRQQRARQSAARRYE